MDQPANGIIPPERDDHAACVSDDGNSMFIFGGYVRGGKSNDFWRFNFE